MRVPDSADALEELVHHHWALDVWASAVNTAEDTLRCHIRKVPYKEGAI